MNTGSKGTIIKEVKKPVKRAVGRLARSNRLFDYFYGGIIRKKRERRYKKFEQLPVDDRLILFESFGGRRYADSPKAIYEYMLSHDEFRDYRFVWCLRGKARLESDTPINDPRTEVVTWGTDEYYKAHAVAGVWYTNARIPEAIQRKENQLYIQCWHGTPLKKLGVDIPGGSQSEQKTTRRVIHNDVKRYSYLVSPSDYYSEKMSSALDLKALGKEAIIIRSGYPRNDMLSNYTEEDAASVKNRLGIPQDKRVLLYAPTYREDNRGSKYEYAEPIDFDRFLERIPNDLVILFRAHYFIAEDFDFDKYDGRIVNVSEYPEINDLYIASDMLLTDYSSVFFDYGILKRPMLFYMYDLEHYRDELRGLYMSLDELPGPVITNQAELEDKISTAPEWASTDEYQAVLRDFKEKFAPMDDGNA